MGVQRREGFYPESGWEPMNWAIKSDGSLEQSQKETVQLQYWATNHHWEDWFDP